MWGKTTAAATDLSFQPVTKERPPSVPGLSVLLMGQQKYHLFSPSKDSARRPHTKSVKLSEIFSHFLFGWNVFCVPVNSDVTMNVPLCLCATAGRWPVSSRTTYSYGNWWQTNTDKYSPRVRAENPETKKFDLRKHKWTFCFPIRLALNVLPQNKSIYLHDHTVINNSCFSALFECLLKT